MSDNIDSSDSHKEESVPGSVAEYLRRAKAACADGDEKLGMHLYLAAFEEGTSEDCDTPCEEALIGLKKAWALACMQKERSLAEYIFEKMEPYLSPDEIAVCAGELQDLALDKLEEFGLSRDDLEDMAELITQDVLGMDVPFVKVEHVVEPDQDTDDECCSQYPCEQVEDVSDPEMPMTDDASADIPKTFGLAEPETDAPSDRACADSAGSINDDENNSVTEAASAQTENDVSGDALDEIDAHNADEALKAESEKSTDSEKPTESKKPVESKKPAKSHGPSPIQVSFSSGGCDSAKNGKKAKKNDFDHSSSPARSKVNAKGKIVPSASFSKNSQQPLSDNPMEFLAHAIGDPSTKFGATTEKLDYDSIAGYATAIATMQDFGIGVRDDEDFQGLVDLLNERHGLDRMPTLDTLLFRAPACEDANRFVAATLGELKLPVLRMSMEENLQGMPVLCVMAQTENSPRLNSMRNAFEGGGVLVLENIDIWGSPFADINEETDNFFMMQLSRGAREAVNLIRSAVENPEVYVFATTSSQTEIDPFFLDLLEPLSFVDIDYPTSSERVDVWMDIAQEHPSTRGVDRADLVRLSANMPRYDIYMAAREAVEEAYKVGLSTHSYQPVTRDNLFDKLAAYQPLESNEYQELEDAVISDFLSDLGDIDDLLEDN